MEVRAGITAVLERAYAPESNERTWLEGIRQAAISSFDGHISTQAFTICVPPKAKAEFGSVVGGNPAANEFMFKMHAVGPANEVRAWYRSGPVVNLLRKVQQSRSEELRGLFERARTKVGHSIVFAAVGTDTSGHACVLTFLPPTAVSLPSTTRSALARVAAHLACAYRLRRAHENTSAVLGSDGKLLHVTTDALVRSRVATLRAAAISIDRARRLAGTDPSQALGHWKAMVDGRWTLVERFESDGRRILVARANPPATRTNRALSEDEHKVVALAVIGHPSKMIGYDLGFGPAKVSRLLTGAIKKLGVRSRSEPFDVYAAMKSDSGETA